jgi:transcriptional regulator with XRE-family HTH domain
MANSIRKKIKLRMVEKEISGAEIARRLGLKSRQHLHAIIGGARNDKVRQAICDALDLPYTIWSQLDKKKRAA